MPEHRDTTPEPLRLLESFLWHDFDAGLADWSAWLARKLPTEPENATSYDRAMQLHAALRQLEAINNGLPAGAGLHADADAEAQAQAQAQAQDALNQLIETCRIHPCLTGAGTLALVCDNADPDPVARLLLVMLAALQSGLWRRFKLCRDPGCRASYYDASKPAAKTWCSMDTCGSRNKMRRFRARG